MKSRGRMFRLLCLLGAAWFCACSGYTRATGLNPEAEHEVFTDGRQVEFVGVPILGDNDNNADLDFVLRVQSVGRVLKIRVHEKSQMGNASLIRDLHTWINEIVDEEQVMVSGKFNRSHEDEQREYGSLELEKIAFLSSDSGFDKPYDTDPSRSFYFSFSAFAAVALLGFAFN